VRIIILGTAFETAHFEMGIDLWVSIDRQERPSHSLHGRLGVGETIHIYEAIGLQYEQRTSPVADRSSA